MLSFKVFRMFKVFNARTPELEYLERIHEVLSNKKLHLSEIKTISEHLQNYSSRLPPVSFGMLCSKITRSTHKHFLGDLLPIARNKALNGEQIDSGNIIISMAFFDKTTQEDWEVMSLDFLKNLNDTPTMRDLACLQKIILNWRNYKNHMPAIKNSLAKIPITHENIHLFASICRGMNDSEMILKVSACFEEFLELIKFEDMTFTAFHLMQVSLLTAKALERILNRINTHPGPWIAPILVRIMQIFVRGPENLEQFNPIFHSKISSNLINFTTRELVNIIHFTVTNPFYAYEPLIKDVYKEMIKKNDLMFNPVDYSSLIHALGKNNLDIQPLLRYLTDKLLSECDGNQLCIIYHYAFNVAPIDLSNKIKKKILEKISQASPKNILNVAKDIAADSVFNVEYWNEFYEEARKIISQHNNTEGEFYNTQLTTIFMKVKKHKKQKKP